MKRRALRKKTRAKELRTWLDVFVWVCLQTRATDLRLGLLSGKGCIELPPDILEVFSKYGLLIENKGRYFFESTQEGGSLLLELLPKEQSKEGLFLKLLENNEA